MHLAFLEDFQGLFRGILGKAKATPTLRGFSVSITEEEQSPAVATCARKVDSSPVCSGFACATCTESGAEIVCASKPLRGFATVYLEFSSVNGGQSNAVSFLLPTRMPFTSLGLFSHDKG